MIPLPEAFEARIRAQFPEEAEEMLRALQAASATSIHLHPLKGSKIHWHGERVDWFEGGLILHERPVFTLEPLFHAGACYPQESSSMFVYHVLQSIYSDERPSRVLDLCAAPGGKSILLSRFIGEEGVLISNEVIRGRNAILRENLDKWPAENAIVTCNDPSDFSAMKSYFDCILVDAPCSGEGMFRKDHAARKEWKEESPHQCALRQDTILRDVWPSLKPGGYLIYSTCTFAPEENERLMQKLASEGGMQVVQIPVNEDWHLYKNPVGWNFLPHKVRGEGFFISVWQKKEDTGSNKSRERRIFSLPGKKEEEIVRKWYEGGQTICMQKEVIWASPLSITELNHLAADLYITRAGTELGRLAGNDFIPAHALALSSGLSGAQRRISISREDALHYLRGQSLTLDAAPGWAVLDYEGCALGWVKVLPNRSNNYYPKEWRIRM